MPGHKKKPGKTQTEKQDRAKPIKKKVIEKASKNKPAALNPLMCTT
jgi:hypothetical protein